MKIVKHVLDEILSNNCGSNIDEVALDTELDLLLNTKEFVEYGIADHI